MSKPRRFVKMFKPQFARLVAAKLKRQTVRPIPKVMPKTGDIISLRMWSGAPYRSKQTILLPDCLITMVRPCIIRPDSIFVGMPQPCRPALYYFAVADGFKDFAEMVAWFEAQHGLPFHGILIEWDPFQAVAS